MTAAIIRNDTKSSQIDAFMCHWNFNRISSCLRRQLTLSWPLALRFLFVTISAVYLIFVLRNNIYFHQVITNLIIKIILIDADCFT